MTYLDIAHQAIETASDPDEARRHFYDALTDAELFVVLEGDPEEETATLKVMDPGTGPIVLVFDLEERLADFAGQDAHYAALSGRALISSLDEKSLGLGLNLGVAPSSYLLDAQGVAWIAKRLSTQIGAVEARFERFAPPRNVPEAMLRSIDSKLAAASGLAHAAYLVHGIETSGAERLILVVSGALEGAQSAITTSIAKGQQLIIGESDVIDLLFVDEDAQILDRIEKIALKFDLPEPMSQTPEPPIAPGSDPDKPPRLR